MAFTQTFSSGTLIDGGVAMPYANEVFPPTTLKYSFTSLNSASVPFVRTLFTPEGSASYQVVAAVGTFNVVGSQTFMLVQASGTTPIGSGAALLNSGVQTVPADTPQYGNVINSAALVTLAPGNNLGFRGTLNGLDPEGVLEVVLQRLS